MTRPGFVGALDSPLRTAVRLSEQVTPSYGSSTLADLLPSVGAHLGVSGCADDPLGLPDAARYVVLLIDGLGWQLIRRVIRAAPYLANLLGDGRAITAGVPSTTVTSLASLGTGLPPGAHGLVGYTFRVPETGRILNALAWDAGVDPRRFQPQPTLFERAAESGVAVTSVGLERFAVSGLTEAALRGAEFVPFEADAAEDVRIKLVVEATRRGDRSLVYAYERELDHTGHVAGCDSAAWLAHLGRIDAMCERLRAGLDDDVRLVITGDHGMVDVPPGQRILFEDEPDLRAGVDAFAGEGRFRQLYVDADSPDAVADRWRDRLGPLAWVRSRDEAVADGWFGTVADGMRPRLGHVLVAMRADWAVMTRSSPQELTLVGMHGSLTAAEMTVPLFCD